MAAKVTSTIELQLNTGFLNRLQNPDDETWLEIYDLYAKVLDPWVPMDEGVLAQSVQVAPDGLTYPGPYAHYMYQGLVYGPNIPVFDEYGEITGWWSPPGQKKHPTGKDIQYSKEKHDLATDHWDEAAMEVKGDEFAAQVLNIILDRAHRRD